MCHGANMRCSFSLQRKQANLCLDGRNDFFPLLKCLWQNIDCVVAGTAYRKLFSPVWPCSHDVLFFFFYIIEMQDKC